MKRYAWVAAALCFQLACSKSPQSYLERGNRFQAAGKYQDAELEYRKSVAQDPKFAEGYYQLGLLEFRLRRGLEALNDLQRAVHFDPANDRYAIDLANVSIEAYQVVPDGKNLYDQAAREADVLLRKDPNSFDGLRLRGDVLVIDRKYDDALAEFRRANAIRPNDPNVILAMAQVLFLRNQDREGEDLIGRFLTVRKDYAPIYNLLEAHYVRSKRLADAAQLLRQEIAALPHSVRPRLELAGLYRDSASYPQMLQVLTQIISDRANFPEGHAEVGDFYANSRKWDDAIAQYRAGLAGSSHPDLYHRKIEQALVALGKREEAIGELNEILKANPKDSQTRLTRALLLRESQDANERDLAGQEFKSLAAQFPGNAVVHYNLGLYFLSKSDPASAGQELNKSVELRNDYIAPRLVLAEMAQSEHNYAGALGASEQALAIDPNNFDAKLLKVAALLGDKSYQEAERELNGLSKLQPDSKEVLLESAELAAGEKDYEKAETLYRRIFRPGSADLRPLEGLLQVYVLERHPEKALTFLGNELKQEPDSRPVHLLLASVATQEGKFDLASQQYHWLQSKDPNSAQVYVELGDLYRLQGVTQDALANYEKASQLAPKDAKILNAIAVLESSHGQPREAIATLNRELALDPNNPAAMNNLAFNLAETGMDLDRALTLAEGVARKFPDDPGVIDTLGWVYAKRGLNQTAIQVFRGLVKKYPNEPTYRYHLGVVLLQQKQSDDAKQEFVAALSQHPSKELSNKIQANLDQVR